MVAAPRLFKMAEGLVVPSTIPAGWTSRCLWSGLCGVWKSWVFFA